MKIDQSKKYIHLLSNFKVPNEQVSGKNVIEMSQFVYLLRHTKNIILLSSSALVFVIVYTFVFNKKEKLKAIYNTYNLLQLKSLSFFILNDDSIYCYLGYRIFEIKYL